MNGIPEGKKICPLMTTGMIVTANIKGGPQIDKIQQIAPTPQIVAASVLCFEKDCQLWDDGANMCSLKIGRAVLQSLVELTKG